MGWFQRSTKKSSAAGILPIGHGCAEVAMGLFIIFGKSMERSKVVLLFVFLVSIYIVKEWGKCKEDIVKKGQEQEK